MKSSLTRKLVLGGLFAALICVMTLFTKWPIYGGQGYIHAGDGFIYAAAAVMGGPWAAVAAAIGSALSDLLSGYFIYAPATFVVKALMALVVGMLAGRKKASPWLSFALMAAASVLMVAGYAAFDWVVYGYAVMLNDAFYNMFQGIAGVAIGMPLAFLVGRILPEEWREAFRKRH